MKRSAYEKWREDVLHGSPPVRYHVGDGQMANIKIGPGTLTIFGGQSGAGKTALIMQCVADALIADPDLAAVITNVEMSPADLLDRLLARFASVPLNTVQQREAIESQLEAGLEVIDTFYDRIEFLTPPFTLERAAATADALSANLLVFDYLQRIPPPGGSTGETRQDVSAVMQQLRRFALDHGGAIVAAAALNRLDKYKRDEIGMHSLRDSSEIEYGADEVYLLVPDEEGLIDVRHEKSRNGSRRSLRLLFNGALMDFSDPGGIKW